MVRTQVGPILVVAVAQLLLLVLVILLAPIVLSEDVKLEINWQCSLIDGRDGDAGDWSAESICPRSFVPGTKPGPPNRPIPP